MCTVPYLGESMRHRSCLAVSGQLHAVSGAEAARDSDSHPPLTGRRLKNGAGIQAEPYHAGMI